MGLTGGLTVSAASTFSGIVDGNAGANFSGAETTLSSATVSDLTAGRVVVAGTSGALEDASTFTFSGGTVSATAFSATNLTGTLQTAAQGNVTSLGTLTGLSVNGDLNLQKSGITSAYWDSSDRSFKFLDGVTQYFGSDNDLWLQHNGSTAYISNTTGDLYIRDDGGDIYIQAKSGENSIVCNNDGNVQLYYDNVNTLQTNANGIKVQGLSLIHI